MKIKLRELNRAEKTSYAKFCRAILQWLETRKNPHNFGTSKGLCLNLLLYNYSTREKYLNPFVEDYPFDKDWNNYSLCGNKFKNKKRMKFVREWASYGVKTNLQ